LVATVIRLRVLCVALALLLMAGAAWAEGRIALVMGLSAYHNAPRLPTPLQDARALADTLRRLNFQVDEHYDLDYRGLAHAIRDFGITAQTADLAVIFYAGHGIQVAQRNYLIPVDARLERERDVVYQAFPVELALVELAQARTLGILILDAGRPNPFRERLARASPIQPGLSRIDALPSHTLVALATRADAVTEDDTGPHSPYTAALLKHLAVPSLELSLFFRRVRDTVLAATDGRQEPVTFGVLGAEPVYFNPRPPNRPPDLAAIEPVTTTDTAPAVALGIPRPTDPDNDRLLAQVTGLPHGGAVRVGDRIVLLGDMLTLEQLAAATFKPDGSVTGTAGAFEFTVMDGRGGATPGQVRIQIEPSNRPPIVAPDRTVQVVANALRLVPPTDPNGDPLTITVTAVPKTGTVRDNGTVVRPGDRLTPTALAGLTFDPGHASAGDAGSFEVTVADGRGGTARSVVRVQVVDHTTPTDPNLEVAVWQRVQTRNTAAAFQAYLHLFPEGQFADRARAQLAERTPGIPTRQPPTATIAEEADASALALADLDKLGPTSAPLPAARPAPETPILERQVATAPPPAPPRMAAPTNDLAEFQDCPSCPVMVRLPAGRFTMGSSQGDPSERPAHTVTLARPFALGKFEVTVGEWQACVTAGGCSAMPHMAGAGARTPVHNLSWLDAQQYTAWLAGTTGQPYRLPSEAEWEYAARGGTTTRYWWGHDIGRHNANCADCGGPYDRRVPNPVGGYTPNPFKLMDMTGGVAEWVADCWFKSYSGAPSDGRARLEPGCRKRVVRGGSWRDDQSYATSSARLAYDADVRYVAHGLRVARDLP
jgi:formylglycine-generating enzyme required for sulfatase activity